MRYGPALACQLGPDSLGIFIYEGLPAEIVCSDRSVLNCSMGRSTMVKIVTDSTADIPPELAGDITVVPCFVQFGEASYLDGVDITREQFYARLAPVTSAAQDSRAQRGHV